MPRRNYKGKVEWVVEKTLDDYFDSLDSLRSSVAALESKLSAQGERVVSVEQKQASALAQPFINSNNTASPDPNLLTQGTGSGNGTVTSVALSVPSIFTVAGSPVATSGTLSFSLNTQTANTILAGPSSGSAVAPTFRALTANDIYTTSDTLLASITVDLNSATSQDLYTAPAGKTLVVTRARARSASGNLSAGGTTTITIIDSGGSGGLTDPIDPTLLTSSTKVVTSSPLAGSAYTRVTSGNKAQARPDIAFGSVATVVIDLYGTLY